MASVISKDSDQTVPICRLISLHWLHMSYWFSCVLAHFVLFLSRNILIFHVNCIADRLHKCQNMFFRKDEIICLKCENLFSVKNKKNIPKCY